jgi:hypothetical protein
MVITMIVKIHVVALLVMISVIMIIIMIREETEIVEHGFSVIGGGQNLIKRTIIR